MHSRQNPTALKRCARPVLYLGIVVALGGCAYGYQDDNSSATAKKVGDDQGFNLLSLADGKGSGKGGSGTSFNVDDPEYQEYLRWKEWQEFKRYQEWKRQEQPGGGDTAPPTPTE